MQQREQYTKIEDFLSDESFRQWILERKDHAEWEEWTLENPQRAKLVEEARMWLLAMQVPHTPPSNAEIQSALADTWKKIDETASEIAPRAGRLRPILWLRAAAAVLVLGLLLSWLYQKQWTANPEKITYHTLVEQDPEGLIEQTNNTNKPQLLTLSDGSSVLLHPNSKLSYPRSFGAEERKVYLSGEGFFEISKNPEKPFFVFANEVVTRVVGTSFRVKAYADQPNVEVVVRTGKVNVSSNQSITKAKNKALVLLPNQGIRFERQNLAFHLITDLTQDTPLTQSTSAIEQLSFDFTDVPVAQILTTIEQAYLLEIDFPQEVLKNCYLTTSLSDQPLPEKLKIICESIGSTTRYEMNGNKITILSSGCE